MSILYLKPGCKVIYCNPDNGSESDQEMARAALFPDAVYEIEKINTGQSYSTLALVGVPGLFNTVMFCPWHEGIIENKGIKEGDKALVVGKSSLHYGLIVDVHEVPRFGWITCSYKGLHFVVTRDELDVGIVNSASKEIKPSDLEALAQILESPQTVRIFRAIKVICDVMDGAK